MAPVPQESRSEPARSARTRELRALLALAWPMVVTQIGAMMLGVVDTVMVGGISVQAIDAATLGNVWIHGTLFVGMGIVLGMDPLAARAQGAGDSARLGFALQQGIATALLVSLPVAVLWLFTEPVLVAFGQSPALAHEAERFVLVQIPGIAPFLVFVALRQYLLAQAIAHPAMWVIAGANLVNYAFNWMFIYGNLGAPELGIVGSGLSTTITRCFLPIAMVFFVRRYGVRRGAWTPWTRRAWRWASIAEVMRTGLPVGLHYGLEIWAFQLAALLAGRLGDEPLAANTIVLNLASLSFMVPLGISIAAATRVGNLLGARDFRGAQRAAWVALGAGAVAMSLSALAFVVLRTVLPELYTEDPFVLELAASLLPIAAAFQLFDGTQVVGAAILRGMGRTRPAVVFNLVGYYVLGLPLAAWLGLAEGWLPGIWWGLCVGLAAVGLSLLVWVWRRGPISIGRNAP